MYQAVIRHFSFSDLQRHPNQVIELLAQAREVALVVTREDDEITVSDYPVYRPEVNELLKEAQAEHHERKQQGYDRRQAFEGFRESQQTISKYL